MAAETKYIISIQSDVWSILQWNTPIPGQTRLADWLIIQNGFDSPLEKKSWGR